MKTMAYLHPTADHCVTTAPQGYDNPRLLVLRSEAEALALQCYSLQQQRDEARKLLADADEWLRQIRAENLDGSERGLGVFLDENIDRLKEWGMR